MIVESLMPDPRRPGSTRVFVDGKPAWTVPSDVIAALHLVEGSLLRVEAVECLDRAAEEEGAFRAALRSLERRAHGERELSLKLERKQHAKAAITAAMARLTALGLLDDLAFARAYVSGKSERGRGPARLRRDLALLGIDRETIATSIGELVVAVEDPLDQPRRLLLKRVRQLTGLSTDARRRRLTAFLGRRGYRGRDVQVLVEQVLEPGH